MYKPKKHKNGYWTLAICQNEALKYQSRIDFIKNSNKAYNAARINGWLDTCCSQMNRLGSKNMRLIYSFEFLDKSVYVGLTYNPTKRQERHLNDPNSQVFKYIKHTNLTPKFKILTEYLRFDVASNMEGIFLENYNCNNWKILNKHKTGGLGGDTLIWTKEKCQIDALKYSTKSEWQKKSGSAANSARKNNWFDECTHHMIKIRNKSGFWNEFECENEAKKYKSKVEWLKTHSYSYSTALKNKWIEKCSQHMHDPRKKWNFITCKIEADKFFTKNEWRKKSPVSYTISSKNRWIDIIWQQKLRQ